MSKNLSKSCSLNSAAILEALEPRLLLSLVAHLELNETSGTTAADTVSDHDGTRYGGTVWDDGRIDNGAYFDGSGDYIEVDNSEDFNFGATDSFTLSTWVRDDGSASFGAALIRGGTSAIGLGYGGNSQGPGFFMGRYSTIKDAYLLSLSDGTYGSYTIYSPAYADGYHLLTMVVDRSTQQLRYYADGVLFTTGSTSSIGSIDCGSEALKIGGTAYWKGMIDDVRIYDHALSTSDVEDLYEAAPTWVSIYADDAIATEDEGADGTATYRVLRTGSLDGAITVNYSVSGTATSADYSETLGGTVTIGDGESYANITITPVDDAADNGQTVILTLASGTGYAVSDIDEATAVIYDEAGLLAYWEMDETSGSMASDSTGNGFDATLYDNATWAEAWIDNGVSLDGSNDYVAVTDADGLDFGASQSFTISAWVQHDGGNAHPAAIAKGNTQAHYGYTYQGAGWAMGRYSTMFAYGITDGTNVVTYYTGVYPTPTDFHLMTMVVDRDSQYLNCYLDGDLKSQQSISSVGSLASFAETLYIGLGNAYWDGILDDARIYDVALDSTAVLNLYEDGMPKVYVEAKDDVAYESSGNTATFRVYRDSTFGDFAVSYSVSGTASSADYSETLSGTVTIANGTSYTDITITPVDDATADDGETLILTVTSGTGYVSGDPDEATVTIYDTDPLIMHLELDETSGSTADDSIGNHDGTLYGDTTWDDGRINNGAYFDGNDYINVANSSDFNFGASDSFTISVWVQDVDSTNFGAALIRGGTSAIGLGYGGNSQGPGFFMGRYSTVKDAYLLSLSDGTYGSYAIYSPAYADGYHLLTMVVDRSTQQLRYYADGVLFTTGSTSSIGSIDCGSDILQIGGAGSYGWRGMIDDVRIYTCALDSDDVADLYEAAPAWVSIYADDAIAIEDEGADGTATFRVLRTGSLDGAITVNYSVSGTATSADYSETLGGTVTIGDGESSTTITITPVDDAADDGQTVILTLASGTGYAVSDIDEATAVIYDEAGLLAYWAMDETSGTTASDSTGNGFDATLYDSATWAEGMIDNGVSLDGSYDYVALSDANGLDFGASQSFTISAWVQHDSGNSHPAVLAKGNTQAHFGYTYQGAGWAMGRYGTSFAYGITDGTIVVKYYTGVYSTPTDFHLMTMVVDRDSQYLNCYLDGDLKSQQSIASVGSLASFVETLYIGKGNAYWDGILDDARIYSYALNSTEVFTLYKDAFPPVRIVAIDSTAYENSANTATFRVYRNDTDGDMVVNYSVSGTASSGDYSETLGGTVTIADGNTYVDITITPVPDAADDGETLIITLADGDGYKLGDPDDATVTIYDDDHLLAHLKLDETSGTTADDAVGNHDGTLTGSTTWDDGRIDNGASFNAGSDSIELANSNDFDFGTSTSFTVSAWVLDDSHAQYATAVSRGNQRAGWSTADGAGWAMGHYECIPGRFYFGITDGSASTSYAVSETYDPQLFHLLTMVVDRSAATMYCYVDGELVGSKSISTIGSIDSTGEALKIASGYNENWTGKVDDLCVYDTALSADDVVALYNNAPTWALVEVMDGTAIEDDADTATFRIYRTGPTNGPMTINYTVSGTASSADYSETLSGTVTLADGESYTDITITPVVDATDNGETVILTLTTGTGYTAGNLGGATATIYDTAQLLMHLKLDETSGTTAADDTGNGHTGTLYGTTTWDDGRIDNGLDFCGGYVQVDNTEDFNFGVSDSFTISTWVRNDGSANFAGALVRGGTSAIGLGYGNNSAGPGFFMGQYSAEKDTYLLSLSDGISGSYALVSPGYADGYHLLTMVVDRSAQQLRYYADGVLFATALNISSIGSIDCGSDLLQIGAAGAYWNGIIDDVRIYNAALSDMDVQELYEDAPTWITLYADDAIASEEAIGTDSATFRLLRTGDLEGAITVNYSVSGTATSADYSETLSGTVTIGDGQSEVEIVLTPVADGSADDGETVTVTLASGTGYEVGEIDEGTVTFYDEAKLLAHWELDETSGSTASDSTGNGFTGTLVGSTTWNYGRVGNGAYFDGNGDYITVTNSENLDFGGDQSFTVSAWMRDDGTASHPAAIAKGNLQAHFGYTSQGPGWAMGRYGSESIAFGVTDGATTATVLNSGSNDGGYHLMTMVVDRGADILRGYIDGVLIGQEDISDIGSLASFAETLYIGKGNGTAKGIIDDVRVYTYALASTDVAALYAATPPMVSIEALDDVASETGSEPATFRITRDGDRDEALEVDYTVTGGASSGDYSETLSGTVTIAAGESYADVTITPVDDASNEGDETVIVTLSPSTDYALVSMAAASQTVTIGDSDNVSDPQVVIAALDDEAGESGSNTGTFRIYRSGATTSDLAVNYTVSGTAEGDDYSETLSGTVTITSGNSYADITITPVEDTNFEYPETLTLTLTADASYTIGLSDDASAVIYDIPFSEQLNPTGDPIGGGVGYSDIIDIGDADYVVDTAAELVAALSSATYGDIIYVEDDAEIDLTGYIADTYYNALFIPEGVTLASGRGNNGSEGGLIYTTDEWDNLNRVAMLSTGGDDVRVTGLRIQGPSGFQLNISPGYVSYASGIRCGTSGGNYVNAEIDNCEIYGWTMAGVYVPYGEGVNIHHNHIYNNSGENYAYGIWFGATNDYDATWAAVAEANYFDANRHSIGSACHWPWAARYNVFGPNQYLQVLDRHSGVSLDTWIENNWIQTDDENGIEFRAGFTSDYGGTVYYNNWTTKEYVGPGPTYTTTAVYAQAWPTLYFDTVASGNTLSFDEHDDSYTPVSDTDVTYLSSPYTVSFDSSDSYDPEGLDMLYHKWWFGDGESVMGETSIEDNPMHIYSEAGMYEAIHWAYNEYGVPGYDSTDVIVRPEEGGYWLSAWVGDAGLDTPTENSYMQILIDENVVWSYDMGTGEGWQHVLVDITSYVTEGTAAEVTFQLVCGGGYYVGMGIDNVYIFGGDVGDSRMDLQSVWESYDPDGSGSGTWSVDTNAERAGRLQTLGGKIVSWGGTGTGEIYQIVSIGKALQPMVTDDFESGDGTGGENWDANWTLTGSAAVTSSGTPFDGTYHLLLTGSSAVASRAVDLSDLDEFGYDDVTLSFQYKADSFETGEEVSVEIYDGTQWQEVMVIEDGDDDGEYHLASIDLSGYSLTDDFEVRFTASLADAGDFFYVDDLMIA